MKEVDIVFSRSQKLLKLKMSKEDNLSLSGRKELKLKVSQEEGNAIFT